MQQRQPRLGDIVDDYCPRERRITNHAVVAMIGDDVKQTRCSTCDAEHQYKQAKIPPQRRKKEVPGVLYQQVLEGMPRKVGAGPAAAAPAELADAETLASPDPVESPEPLPEMAEPTASSEAEPDDQQPVEEGPVHRRLIRATLPRLTDEPPPRREPEFTIRNTQNARHGRFGKNAFRGHRPGVGGPGERQPPPGSQASRPGTRRRPPRWGSRAPRPDAAWQSRPAARGSWPRPWRQEIPPLNLFQETQS
jgi:hypothetical protein